MSLSITPSAQEYLYELLTKQDTPGTSVRVFVNSPGTPRAETCLAYCKPGENLATDQAMDGLRIPVWLEADSLPYLEDAQVDYKSDDLGGGQLTIVAPNARLPQIDENSTTEQRITYVLHNEINPGLAAHGGFVQLVEYRKDDATAILQFGGGCQGCGMVDYTLKEGIETTLKARVPELEKVADVTDHSDSSQAYYK